MASEQRKKQSTSWENGMRQLELRARHNGCESNDFLWEAITSDEDLLVDGQDDGYTPDASPEGGDAPGGRLHLDNEGPEAANKAGPSLRSPLFRRTAADAKATSLSPRERAAAAGAADELMRDILVSAPSPSAAAALEKLKRATGLNADSAAAALGCSRCVSPAQPPHYYVSPV
jgi:hypothetical protein